MKVASVQMTSGDDIAANVRKACDFVRRAAGEGAELVVLPEFFKTIFFAQHWDTAYNAFAETDCGFTMTAIRETAMHNNIAVVATIYEEAEIGLCYDTAMHVGVNGEIHHKYRKLHPAGVKSLEKLYFRYGSRLDTYKFADWQVGIGICYDMGFPETARCLAANGAELLIAPYATSRQHMFQEVLRTRSFENGCYLVAANKVGQEHDWYFPGGSMISDPTGKLLASADTESETLLFADKSGGQARPRQLPEPARPTAGSVRRDRARNRRNRLIAMPGASVRSSCPSKLVAVVRDPCADSAHGRTCAGRVRGQPLLGRGSLASDNASQVHRKRERPLPRSPSRHACNLGGGSTLNIGGVGQE